jgi:hypothetical protein
MMKNDTKLPWMMLDETIPQTYSAPIHPEGSSSDSDVSPSPEGSVAFME